MVRLLLKYLTEDNERELVDLALEAGEANEGDTKEKPEYYLRLRC